MSRGGRIDPMRFPEGTIGDDERIDIAIAESFPASDPPSWNAGMDRPRDWRIVEILAATDLSDCSRNALDHAIVIAHASGAGLSVIHVGSGSPRYEDMHRAPKVEPRGRARYADLYTDRFDEPIPSDDPDAEDALIQAHTAQLERMPAAKKFGFAGEPIETILETAGRQHASMIVVGSHARGAIAEAILGSTADGVVRRSDVPVLAVACGVSPREQGRVVAILDEPDAADEVLRHAHSIAHVLRAPVVELRVENDGRVDRRPEVADARMIVIAFPHERDREVSRRDPNVTVLLRKGICPILTIPAEREG